jgi:hypothetical protein
VSLDVGNWPVQFIPAFDRLTKAAIVHAEKTEIDGERIRTVLEDLLQENQ